MTSHHHQPAAPSMDHRVTFHEGVGVAPAALSDTELTSIKTIGGGGGGGATVAANAPTATTSPRSSTRQGYNFMGNTAMPTSEPASAEPMITKHLTTQNSAATPHTTAAAHNHTAIVAYNGPRDVLQTVVKTGVAKSLMPLWQLALLGFNSGVFVSFGNLCGLIIGGGLSASTSVYDSTGVLIETIPANPVFAKFAHGAIFPIGLVLIILTSSDLFTGNVMYMSTAWVSGKIKFKYIPRNLLISWFANFAGSLFCAYFLGYLTEMVHHAPELTYLTKVATKKMGTGWGSIFLKGIGCNWMVCLAIWSNMTAQDVAGKILAMWMPIATFAWIAWEHSIANMFLLPLSLMEGVPGRDVGDMIWRNLIPATLGNTVGGLIFAMGQWAVFGQHQA